MVGDEQELADVRLSGAVRDLREQVDRFVDRERLECRAILAERGDRVIPRLVAWRLGRRRPVIVRPGRLLVARVAAEVEDVPLRDAQVLDELPRRMRKAADADAAVPRREPFDGLLEADVRVLPGEDTAKLLAE